MNANQIGFPTITMTAPSFGRFVDFAKADLTNRISKTGQVGCALITGAQGLLQAGGYYLTNGAICKEGGFSQLAVSRNLFGNAWNETLPLISVGMVSCLGILVLIGEIKNRTNAIKQEKAPSSETLNLKNRIVTVVKETSALIALSILFRGVMHEMAPTFQTHFPAFNSLVTERSNRWIQFEYSLTAIFVKSCLAIGETVLPKVDCHFNHGLRQTFDCRDKLMHAAGEELLFRGLIQTLLLNSLPKIALEVSGYSTEEAQAIANHQLAKAVRVVVTSFLFMAVHSPDLGDQKGGLINQFLMGLVFGILKESGISFTQLSLFHFFYNFSAIAVFGGEMTVQTLKDIEDVMNKLKKILANLELINQTKDLLLKQQLLEEIKSLRLELQNLPEPIRNLLKIKI